MLLFRASRLIRSGFDRATELRDLDDQPAKVREGSRILGPIFGTHRQAELERLQRRVESVANEKRRSHGCR